MPKRIAMTQLNASTVDILNTIRANAPYEYQSLVPEIRDTKDIPRVGEVIYGYPNCANYFLTSLMNRIALVRVKAAVFNNAYTELKKGYLKFGETVEEVFVNIAKAREFSPEKAADRELKRSLPDVRSAFHTMNWRVQYPVTIQDEDLRQAFTSINGVQDLIAKIVDSIYTAAEYDEYLLFKYLIIKGITRGKMYPVSILDGDMKNAAVKFRGTSNLLTFMKTQFNAEGVHTTTPKSDQYIFMDSEYNAQYDVNVLSAAFNMDKADFMGKLMLIDDFTTFDNERFDEIRANSDMIEEVTPAELALMQNVKAVLVDREWFQMYDNNNKFTEKYVASGMYWNYFYNVWKTVSYSPFSNAVVFVADGAISAMPDAVTFKVESVVESDNAKVMTFVLLAPPALNNLSIDFKQTEILTRSGVAVHRYGAIIVPNTFAPTTVDLEIEIDDITYNATGVDLSSEVGTTITANKG